MLNNTNASPSSVAWTQNYHYFKKLYLIQKMTPIFGTDPIRGTDGRNQFQNVLSKTFQMIHDMPTKAEN